MENALILRPHLLSEAQFGRKEYRVTLEQGTQYEDMFDPSFWAHVALKLKVDDLIQVKPADGSWWAELLVRSKGRVSVTVAELRKVDFADAKQSSGDEGQYEIKWRGPNAKWSAVHKVTKAIAVEGLETKEEVSAWLKKPQAQAA